MDVNEDSSPKKLPRTVLLVVGRILGLRASGKGPSSEDTIGALTASFRTQQS